uniref:Uncharacterized protein n=1 Tax=Periophthalmus magnuspinnatus TaxID=409849 RepID=A0A3B3ZSS7_9GOBI
GYRKVLWWVVGAAVVITLITIPAIYLNEQVEATDYMLSGDYNFVALESNYTKKWRHSYSASYTIFNRETAYVSDFNVFLKSDVNADAVQVTFNGKENEISNGIPDWTYEEVFASNGALWWSTNSVYLAYAEFNDTLVHKIEYTWYGNEQYPETVSVPYPKDHILCSVTWVTDQRVAVQWMTRKQNYVIVQLYEFDGSSWVEKQIFEQRSRTGWVGRYVPLPLFFAEDKLSFYKVMSDSHGYKHIHYVKDGKATPITSGEWEVTYINKLTKDAYFVSNQNEGIPVKINQYSSHSAPECLSCDLRPERCQYNTAYFSYDASYYRLDCTPGLPVYTLMDNRGAGALEDNKELENMLSDFQMPTMKYGTFKVAGFLWYQMMLPPNFKKSKKYPLLIDYGGPCSQTVSYRYKLNWATYLTSTHDIIYASFDGRGSGYQGDQILHSIYHRLGTYEVEDQLFAIKFIDMGFVDKDRVAMWGWSYGGYVTAMALGSGSGLLKCGISVAPVAEWEYYAVYTERYMGTPSDNPDGYRNGSVITRAKNFKNVDFLLIHGTADNVHFQQAAQISKALVNEQVDFEAMWYTDKNHSLRGSAYRHVYTLMSHFLKK